MKYTIQITKNAEKDISETIKYIDCILKNPSAGNNLLYKIDETLLSLNEFPKKYPIVDDPFFKSLEIRSISIKNYLLFYIISEENLAIFIIRFLYGKSNWKVILRNDN